MAFVRTIAEFAYYPILGLPVIAILGILTIACLLITALIGYMNFRGLGRIPMKWHFRFAAATVTLAIIHGLIGLALNL